MTQSHNPLKIVLDVHHFPLNFRARAHRIATWLQRHSHRVKLVWIESINDTQTNDLHWPDRQYSSLPVRHLFLNLVNTPDLIRWEYDNPWVEAHLTDYLAEEKPDIFHLGGEIG